MRIIRSLGRLAALCLTSLALGACALPERRGPVIFAASSLQAPLEQLAAEWSAQGKDAPVLSFASSASLARQIENGAPADIFISADSQWTDYIATAAKLDPSGIKAVATNRLVIAQSTRSAPLASTGQGAAEDALKAAKTVATGDPDTVPLGTYAREALTTYGLWEQIVPRIIPAGSAQAAVKLVLLGEADLGVLYASDAARRSDLGVIWEIPETSHSPILYRALRLPASAHPDAEAFLQFLASAEAGETFRKQGFARP